MKNTFKATLIAVLALTSSVSIASQISPDFLKTEIDIAHSQYLSGSTESGLYALEALSRLLEATKSGAQDVELGPNNLAYTYVRLGLLHEKAGNQTKATMYFNKATEAYQGADATIEQLKTAAVMLDSKLVSKQHTK
jgi:tetratricopeptide (TPR) repeat protein